MPRRNSRWCCWRICRGCWCRWHLPRGSRAPSTHLLSRRPMSDVRGGLRSLWRRLKEAYAMPEPTPISAAENPAVAAFRDDVLTRFPFTAAACEWLTAAIGFEVEDLSSTRGGGFWYPEQNKVFLFTAQYEAAIHELAHAWW